MGGTSSVSSLFTPQEVADIEKIKVLQDSAVRFVSLQLFYGVPVRSGRKAPHDPIGMIWIEPQPEVLENPSSVGVTENLLYGLPTGVAVDSKGRIRIIFAETNIEYTISPTEVAMLDRFRFPGFEMPPPAPPSLHARTTRTIEIHWKDSLPYSAGIITSVEIQYLSVKAHFINDQIGVLSKKKSFVEGDDGGWNSLVTKLYSNSHFMEFTMDYLKPGKVYCFRMRYRCPAGWSDFSSATEKITTEAEVPSAPMAPTITSISCFAALLSWTQPSVDNGSTITEYVLQGKSTGDSFSTLYSGSDFTYLVLGLYPDFSYSFRVAAVNGVGMSEFSKIASFQAPVYVHGAGGKRNSVTSDANIPDVPGFTEQQVSIAIDCVHAWQEHWDPLTEQPFYFNTVIGIRQLEVPEAMRLLMAGRREEGSSVEPERRRAGSSMGKARSTHSLEVDEFIKSFRKKRYRLVRSLHNRKRSLMSNDRIDAPPVRSNLLRTSDNNSTSSQRGGSKVNDVIFLRLRRGKLLQDYCNQLLSYRPKVHNSKAELAELLKRIKVQFVGEEGIDAGGLVKEAFLLLSREFIKMGLSKNRQFVVELDEVAPKYGNIDKPNDSTELSIDRSSARVPQPRSAVVAGGIFFAEKQSAIKSMKEDENDNNDCEVWQWTRAEYGYLFGVFLGKAIMDRQLVEVPLSLPLLQHMLGDYDTLKEAKVTSFSKVNVSDIMPLLDNEIRSIDETLAKSLKYILATDNITEIVEETFSVSFDNNTIPLCARGESIDVTDENKAAYVYLMAVWKLIFSLSDILEPFVEGFHSIVPMTSLKDAQISPQELYMMLNGKDSIDVEELRAYVIYEGDKNDFHECSPSIVWLWRFVRDLEDAEQRKFLLFFTGSSRVPLDGYDPPLTITDGVDMVIDSLPKAHTCFNQLVLPRYSSYEKLKEKISYAMDNTEGFGLI